MAMVSRDRIEKVVACGSWQAFRVFLKKQSTVNKLAYLRMWLEADDACQYIETPNTYGYMLEEGLLYRLNLESQVIKHPTYVGHVTCAYSDRRDQVLNYLNALARGGQIEPMRDEVWKSAMLPGGTIQFDMIWIRR